jgi:NAD(P)-dependent dehydrogenase (short-subunit alcohol dehydrogenase family)
MKEPIMKRFEKSTVLIIGGTEGIGLATAIQLTHRGARVIITGQDQERLECVKTQLGNTAIAICNNGGAIEAAKDLVQILSKHDAKLDAVFINADVTKTALMDAVCEALWDKNVAIAAENTHFTLQALAPASISVH